MSRCLSLLFFLLWLPFAMHAFQPVQPDRFPFRIELQDDTDRPLQISSVKTEVLVVGNIATTTYDVSIYNPNYRVLEGSLEIPLADGQTMTRFALDIGGALREGVAVEKAKARTTFESIVRRNVDPGLLEQTQGNNFRARVYPIPSLGNRRFVFAVEELLLWENQALRYDLPLYFDDIIKDFSLKVMVQNQTIAPTWENNNWQNFGFEQWQTGYLAEHAETNFKGNRTLTFSVPKPASFRDVYITPTGEGDHYFLINTIPAIEARPKPLPDQVTIFWDASSSVTDLAVTRQLALLEAYFQKNQNVTIELVPFRNVPDAPQTYRVRNGNWVALKEALQAIEYDGGTSADFFEDSQWQGKEIWLFSDGLFTLSEVTNIKRATVYTFCSSPSANFELLTRLATNGGGAFINLLKVNDSDAVTNLTTATFQFLGAKFGNEAISEVFPNLPQSVTNGQVFTVSGRLSKPSAEILLQFGVSGQVHHEQRFTVRKEDAIADLPLGKQWAYDKYQALAQAPVPDESNMLALAKRYTLVTPQTSLLVLETLKDYVEYRIIPPAEMRRDYFAALEEQKKEIQAMRSHRIATAISQYKERIDWWEASYEGWKKGEFYTAVEEDENGTPVAPGIEDESTRLGSAVYASAPEPEMERSDASAGSTNEEVLVEDASQEVLGETIANTSTVVPMDQQNAKIEIEPWSPERPYLKVLEGAKDDLAYAKYLEQKLEWGGSPGFYLDVALYFEELNSRNLSMRILSNLAEMQLESDELLRTLAHQYRQWNELDRAEWAFRKLLAMREEHPQSYRDLAQVLTLKGEKEEAAELYWHVISEMEEQWLSNFPNVRELCLYEWNQIHKEIPTLHGADMLPIDVTNPLPVDVRVVMTWNVTDVDIDLWLVDPQGEPCMYSNTITRNGARYTSDYTGGGLGPEEILLKDAVSGEYTVKAHYYGSTAQRLLGPVTVQVAVYIHYGTDSQEMKELTLQLEEVSDTYTVGTFTF